MKSNPGLYHRALGEAFENLPSIMRSFHDHPDGGTASGTLCVTRGHGWLRNALATLMRLPPPGEKVPVLLQVRVRSDEEHWFRTFGPLQLVTRQWLKHGLLMEAAGPVTFAFRLSCDAREMRFEFVHCRFMGVPLPYAISPRVTASATDAEDGWWITVSVEAPVIGLLTRYEGKVIPQC